MLKDWQLFGQRLAEARKALNKNQQEMADQLRMAQTHWSRLENAKARLTIDKLYTLMHLWNINPAWLLSGRGAMFLPRDDGEPTVGGVPLSAIGGHYDAAALPLGMVRIPILATVAALGQPIENEVEPVVDQALLFRPKVPHPSETYGIRVKGESMYPTLQDGWLIFVDRHPEAIQPLSALDKKLVVVRLDHGGGGISIKRLRVDPNGLLITADHPAAAFQPVALPLDQADHILAKVLGWWGEQ